MESLSIREAVDMVAEKSITSRISLVSSIFEITNETLNTVYEDTEEILSDNIYYAYLVIMYAMDARPKKRDLLGSLMLMLFRNHGFIPNIIQNNFPFNYDVFMLLVEKGITTYEDTKIHHTKPLDELLHFYPPNTLERALVDDDIELLIKLASEPEFEINVYFEIDESSPLFNVNGRYIISVMQFIAFFGSIKCFRFALLNLVQCVSNTNMYAIAGGNKEIIKMLENENTSFDGCFRIAAEFHRIDLCDWLIRSYSLEEMPLIDCLNVFNEELFHYFIKRNINLNYDGVFECAALHGNLDIVEMLVKKGIPKVVDSRPLSNAIVMHNFSVVKYLYENHLYDKKNGYTPLHDATYNGFVDIIRYFVHQGEDIELLDEYGDSPLNVAAYRGHLKAVKYLVRHKANIENANSEGFTALHSATKNNHKEIVEYLLRKGASKTAKDKYGRIPSFFSKNDEMRSIFSRI